MNSHHAAAGSLELMFDTETARDAWVAEKPDLRRQADPPEDLTGFRRGVVTIARATVPVGIRVSEDHACM